MGIAWVLVVGAALQASEDVRWQAPAGCPDAAEVRALVERRIGRPLAPGELTIDGHIAAEGDAYRLELELARGGARQRRSIPARDCAALGRVTALVAGLAIDAVAIAEQEAAALVPEPDAAARPTTQPDRAGEPPTRVDDGPIARVDAPLRAAPRRRALQLLLALTGGIERGALPGITGGIEAAIGLRGRGFRVELAGMWLAPRVRSIGVASVRAQLGTVAVRGCPELALARVSVPLCVGVEVGAMRGRGDGAPGATLAHGAWVAPTIGPGLRVGRGRVAFVARGEVAIAALRPAFDLREPGEPISVFAPPPVSARLWLGVEFRLGRDGSTR